MNDPFFLGLVDLCKKTIAFTKYIGVCVGDISIQHLLQ